MFIFKAVSGHAGIAVENETMETSHSFAVSATVAETGASNHDEIENVLPVHFLADLGRDEERNICFSNQPPETARIVGVKNRSAIRKVTVLDFFP